MGIFKDIKKIWVNYVFELLGLDCTTDGLTNYPIVNSYNSLHEYMIKSRQWFVLSNCWQLLL